MLTQKSYRISVMKLLIDSSIVATILKQNKGEYSNIAKANLIVFGLTIRISSNIMFHDI